MGFADESCAAIVEPDASSRINTPKIFMLSPNPNVFGILRSANCGRFPESSISNPAETKASWFFGQGAGVPTRMNQKDRGFLASQV
jgi:hypothetical protein